MVLMVTITPYSIIRDPIEQPLGIRKNWRTWDLKLDSPSTGTAV